MNGLARVAKGARLSKVSPLAFYCLFKIATSQTRFLCTELDDHGFEVDV